MGKVDVEALHDAYCAGYHNLPRTVKRHLSIHDMYEIWFHMVRPVVDTLAAENEAAWKSANMWEAEVGAYLRECAELTAELESLKQQVPEGVWIEWNGGECPVPMGTLVDVVHRNGYKYCNQLAGASGSHAEDWSWMDDHPADIISYRIAPRECNAAQAKAEPQGVGATQEGNADD